MINCDWWDSIFKPNFTFTECNHILNLTVDEGSETSSSLQSDDINPKKGFRKVSNDIENDKNVYRLLGGKNPFNISMPKYTSENNLTSLEILNNEYLCHDSSTQTDACIWNTKELGIIRSCVKDFKHKNHKLSALAANLRSKNEELKAKNLQLEKRLLKKHDILREAVKANDRFHILTDTVSDQLDQNKKRNQIYIEQRTAMLEEKIDTENKIDDLQKDIMEKDNVIAKQMIKLENIGNQFSRSLDRSVCSAVDSYKKKIDQLQLRLNEETKALNKESYLRRATEKGFQQLLRHFSDKKTTFETRDLNSIKYGNM